MNAASRLRKLRTMSAPELRSRLARAAFTIYERRVVTRGRNLPRHASINAVSPRPFLPSTANLSRTRDTLASAYAREARETLARAVDLLSGRFRLFGEVRPLGGNVDWHADPVSGKRWPFVYHADVPVGDRSRAPGDAKDVWELNRHQWLVDLGKAWLLTGDRVFVDAADRFVASWIALNPYGVGVNWSGPLEVAYRALSWIWAQQMTRDGRVNGSAAAWNAGFHDHGRYLYRHLELFESPFNHLIGEAAVLYLLGLLFPEHDEAGRWRERGRHVLESRLGEQFYADGGSVEQATVYHHATLGFYLLAALAGRANGEEMAAPVWRAIERGIDHSMRLLQPDGRMPALGDNDDARPLAFDAPDTWDYRHFQAAGAVLFKRPDFKWTAGRFPEDAFWLLGPDGLDQFDTIDASPPADASSALRASGYAVLRTDWSPRADYVCFDCGQQGGGLRADDVPSASHGHADALSVVAHLRGQPLLVDSGFYTYDGERDWERHFRETAAHNTISIDGLDQAIHLEKMAWMRTPTVTLEAFQSDRVQAWAIASHDGYARTSGGVRHRRMAWLRPGGYLLIYDELEGSGDHVAEVSFQFAPGLDLAIEGGEARIQSRFGLTWCSTSALAAAVCAGVKDSPRGGWVSPRLGARVPAARLTLKGGFTGSLRVLSILADREAWPGGVRARCEGDPAVLVQRLHAADREEIVAASAGRGITLSGYSTDAAVAVWRLERAIVTEAAHAGGSFIRPEANR